MSLILAVVHITVCLFLILIVLLQTGKGADLGAAFGGGSSQTLFGAAGPAGFFTKITTGVAIVFMVTSISLAYLHSNPTVSSSVGQAKPIKAAPPPAPTPVEKGTPIQPAPQSVPPPAAK